ncbi:FAD-binding oxidoreductase [Rhizobium sp. NRK18]|uniref:FAD-binding oxidoreductase n=1 Tax=Rhizobium sp. NRK18 TaxID=2964667 RepID=UPI0021C301EB|nr:FAD-binding oxidoreductase [Rhizobium sp. NRK18]MCQ2005985.1 FAD-binding oxidoreductase [Rhizobium sp. NRK18]
MNAIDNSAVLPAGFLSSLEEAVGPRNVKTGADVLGADPGWHPDNLRCGVVVYPGSTDQVAAVVRLCREHRIAIVPHGGKTGLVGGGISKAGEIVVSLERMNRIERLDPVEQVAVVEAGAILQTLQEAAAVDGLSPGIDLAARGSATIGGLVSTNAGGIMAFRNGVMRHRVLGLEAVLADGSVFSDLTRVVKNSAGYDLKHLFIGAEGTLGIVTRVAVKLEPLVPEGATALFGLPSLAAVFALLTEARTLKSGQLAAAEAMWSGFFGFSAGNHGWSAPGYRNDNPVNLLLSFAGHDEVRLAEDIAVLYETMLERFPETEAVLASSLAQRDALWRLREDTEQVYHAFPAAPSYDVSVPLSETEAYVARLEEGLQAVDPDLKPLIFGHIADGNLHIILNRRGGEMPAETLAAAEAALYKDIRFLGGSFSAEHGVGSKRIHSLTETADPVKLRWIGEMKRFLDPDNLFNPGKLVG